MVLHLDHILTIPAFGTDVVIKVKVISWSMSSQGHNHVKVKVILELNGNVFQFLSWSGWLAFFWVLIFLGWRCMIAPEKAHPCYLYSDMYSTETIFAMKSMLWPSLKDLGTLLAPTPMGPYSFIFASAPESINSILMVKVKIHLFT